MLQVIKTHPKGFTLLELLATIVIISVLATILLPALETARSLAIRSVCGNNERQLLLGWTLYSDDNDDNLAPNSGGRIAGKEWRAESWVAGWLTLDGGVQGAGIAAGQAESRDNTNTALLVHQGFGSIGAYTKDAQLYLCPNDASYIHITGRRYRRCRSYAMNCFLGDTYVTLTDGSPYRAFRRFSDISAWSPSQCWVFIEEHERSIDDGYFWIPLLGKEQATSWQELPASHHDRSCNLGFADGHVQVHRWTDTRTLLPFVPIKVRPIACPGNVDVQWLRTRTSVPK
jgi:prepilin-type N-terminal cleavage/methylation domain-containing protein/prepilin-type processing-associated H-X9-DG protein